MTINCTTLTGAKTVTGSIRSWVNHASISPADVLTEAEARIYQNLRHWKMIVEATGSASIGAESITLPTDFVAPIKLQIWGMRDDGLPYVHESLFRRYVDEDGAPADGDPTKWTIQDGVILFDSALSQELSYDFVYYGKPDALAVTTNETNFLTTDFPTLLRRACMAVGFEYRMRWGEAEKYEELTMRAIREANIASDSARYGQEI